MEWFIRAIALFNFSVFGFFGVFALGELRRFTSIPWFFVTLWWLGLVLLACSFAIYRIRTKFGGWVAMGMLGWFLGGLLWTIPL